MIESPLIQELLSAERQQVASATRQQDILTVLEARFDVVPFDLATRVRSIVDEERLNELVRKAGSCRNLDEFRAALPAGSP